LKKARDSEKDGTQTLDIDVEYFKSLKRLWWAMYIALPLVYLFLTLIF